MLDLVTPVAWVHSNAAAAPEKPFQWDINRAPVDDDVNQLRLLH